MKRRSVIILSRVSAAFLAFMTAAVQAGDQPVITGSTTFYPAVGTGQGPKDTEVNAATTSAIVDALNQAARFCGGLTQKEYVVDCLAHEYWEIQERISDSGEYADAKQAIRQAADKLNALARSERSRTKRPATLSRAGPSPHRTTRPVVPVSTASLPSVSESAARIIEESQTVLLRSVGNSERRRRQFQRIADAMDTGTILIRSL